MSMTKDELMGLQRGIQPCELADGKVVYILELLGSEFDRLREKIQRNGKVDEKAIFARFVVACACDENGQRLFADGDIAEANSLPLKTLKRLAEEAQRVNGLTKEDAEELAGKSETTTN